MESIVETLREKLLPLKDRPEDITCMTPDPSDGAWPRRLQMSDNDPNLVSNLDFEEYGQLFDKARDLRLKEWILLESPETKTAPKRVISAVGSFCDFIINDSKQLYAIPTLKDTEIASLRVREDELDGDIRDEDIAGPQVIKDRVLIGKDTPVDELIFCSQYSVCIKAKDSKLKKLMRESIPTDLIPMDGDDKASLQERMLNNRWLDELHQHKQAPKETLVNKDPRYRCPNRRTNSLAIERPYMIGNRDSKDYGRYVTPMYSYTCKEAPMTRQMSRPMNMLDLGFCLENWLDAWPWSTATSRRFPPNFIQKCLYHAETGCKMGQHRDNFTKVGLDRMKKGGMSFIDGEQYAGLSNSQVYGSNVYIYTTGSAPMTMTFSYPNPHKGLDQKPSDYVTLKCFAIQCNNGYLTVIDPLDDVLGTHGVTFDDLVLESVETREEGGKGNQTDLRWRVAFVMRMLENVEEYFVDSSFIRPNDNMLEALKTSTANNYVGENDGRNAYE